MPRREKIWGRGVLVLLYLNSHLILSEYSPKPNIGVLHVEFIYCFLSISFSKFLCRGNFGNAPFQKRLPSGTFRCSPLLGKKKNNKFILKDKTRDGSTLIKWLNENKCDPKRRRINSLEKRIFYWIPSQLIDDARTTEQKYKTLKCKMGLRRYHNLLFVPQVSGEVIMYARLVSCMRCAVCFSEKWTKFDDTKNKYVQACVNKNCGEWEELHFIKKIPAENKKPSSIKRKSSDDMPVNKKKRRIDKSGSCKVCNQNYKDLKQHFTSKKHLNKLKELKVKK